MKFLIFVVLTLVAVQAYRNPTSVCTPYAFEVDFYDFDLAHFGTGVVDHDLRKMAISVPSRSLIVLYNWDTLRGYQIDTHRNTCHHFNVSAAVIPPRCLSASSTPLKDGILKIGDYVTSNTNDVVAYDVPVIRGLQFRVIFTNTTPAYPVYRQLITESRFLTHHMGKHLLFFNTRRYNIQRNLFDKPSSCGQT